MEETDSSEQDDQTDAENLALQMSMVEFKTFFLIRCNIRSKFLEILYGTQPPCK